MIETLKKVPYIYFPKFFNREEILLYNSIFIDWNLRPVPQWLGNFNFSMDKTIFNLSDREVDLYKQLKRLVGEQSFNTIFRQRYKIGEEVKLHQDPMNNIGATIIAHFGDYEGGKFHCDGYGFTTNPGDVIVMRCNINGLSRPKHMVSQITKGTKYSFILNTIS